MTDAQPTPESAPAPDTGGGEGAGTTQDGFYDLSEVAPELRPGVEKHLKEIEGRVTPKLQEAAQLREQWEPYNDLGLGDYDPEELGGLLTFAQLTSAAAQGDQEALADFAEWYERIGEQLGLGAEEGGDEYGEYGDEDGESDLAEQIAQAVEPLYEKMAEQEQQQVYQEALSQVEQATAKLQSEHGLSDQQIDTVLRLAQSFEDDDDPVNAGFEEYKRIAGEGEKSLFETKQRDNSTPPEGEGPADTSVKATTDFDEAKAQARERMARALST